MAVSKTTTRKISKEISSRRNHYPRELLRTLPREHHGSRKVRRQTSSHFEEPAAAQQQEVVHYRQQIQPLTRQQVLCAVANVSPTHLRAILCLHKHPREWNRGAKSFICLPYPQLRLGMRKRGDLFSPRINQDLGHVYQDLMRSATQERRMLEARLSICLKRWRLIRWTMIGHQPRVLGIWIRMWRAFRRMWSN